MRIIAGEFRGRKILPPASDATRPITDRVKQSVFDILTPLLDGATVFDCFAGTGSMGLECLSRGAKKVLFFESDRSALKLLDKNIEALKLRDRADIIPGDLFKWFESPTKSQDSTIPADIIFLDPPYSFLKDRPRDLQQLITNLRNGLLQSTATIVFRHDANDALDLPGTLRTDQRIYGGMAVEFLRVSGYSHP